ncbi:LysR family transcriptional regulator [Aliidiomarina minuta]|uniref:LysR family transcriptional regulator n=1 Tax=Aliidiomarina minuta TaxID=880057 RepID=A0A432W5R7_9GAMM|nr:LysR family transcriptional regulator [Aliidiomarina minuta]RUO25319.1 LysR family transcriptional regulator [Aliidiomarina minuta]
MSDSLQHLRILCAAVESRNFKEAARRLGISPQSVTRSIQYLEGHHGEMLFLRNTRKVQVTSFGESLAQRARSALLEFDDLLNSNKVEEQQSLSGLVRITAPSAIGPSLVTPVIARINQQYPNIRFDLRFDDQRTDVVNERVDIGIRIGAIRDNRFIVRKLRNVHFHVVATPALLAQQGVPQKPQDLQQLPCTAIYDRSSGKAWPWEFINNQLLQHSNPVLLCDNIEAEYKFILNGGGIGQIIDFFAHRSIASGQLQEVLSEFAPEPWDMYVFRPQQGPVAPRIRIVFDALVKELSVDKRKS